MKKKKETHLRLRVDIVLTGGVLNIEFKRQIIVASIFIIQHSRPCTNAIITSDITTTNSYTNFFKEKELIIVDV